MKRAAGDEKYFFSRLYLRTGRDNLLPYMFFGLRLSLQLQTIVNKGNGYETRQSALLYVFVLFFGLDPAQNTIVVYSVLRN